MTWVDLSSVFTYGSQLTSTQMQNLRDNITALANGDSGAPSILISATELDSTADEIDIVCDGALGAMKLIEQATLSAAANHTFSGLSAGSYLITGFLNLSDNSANDLWMLFNADNGSNYLNSISSIDSRIMLSSNLVTNDDPEEITLSIQIEIDPSDPTVAFAVMQNGVKDSNYNYGIDLYDNVGRYNGAAAVTSILIDATSGTLTGTINLFKLNV